MRRRAIVTGGAGFIGSHMVDLLVENDFDVIVIDNLTGGNLRNLASHKNNLNVTLVQRDIRSFSYDDPIFHKADFFFHFAGIGDIVPSIERPTEYMDVNVQGTVRMLECARYNSVKKFVYAASSTCYGIAQVPTSESASIRPRFPYALSKYLGELACLHWGQVYGLPLNSLRIFNAYGTRSRTTGSYGAVFGVFLRQKIAGRAFTIVGDGTQKRDFVYVTDVARAFLLAALADTSGRVYNIGAGNPHSINRLCELLDGPTEYIPKRPGEPDCTWADISLAATDLGWRPQVTFEQGVTNVLHEINYWKDAPLWDKSSISEATAAWFKYLG